MQGRWNKISNRIYLLLFSSLNLFLGDRNVICLVSFLTPSSEWVVILHLLLQMKEEILESLLTYSSHLTLLCRIFSPSFGIPNYLLLVRKTSSSLTALSLAAARRGVYSLCTRWNTRAQSSGQGAGSPRDMARRSPGRWTVISEGPQKSKYV